MIHTGNYLCAVIRGIAGVDCIVRPKKRAFKKLKLLFLSLLVFLITINGYAQTDQTSFPSGNFWSLDAGIGISDILVEGISFQFVLDPKLWLSPTLMVGSKVGINYSSEENSHNILTFEGQVYLRWNFLRLGKPQNTTNVFLQGGLGLLSAYRGKDSSPFSDVTMTRGSVLADAAFGVTIPLSARWHIEPLIRGGYPHIAGFSLTAGYKFPLPQATTKETQARIEYVEIVKTLPPEEIIKRIMIAAVEFILFGPDIGKYNIGIDHDAQGLNELVLNQTAQLLKDNPNYRLRIEGHANPVTTDPNEADELMALSAMRAHTIADQLRARDVKEEQMIIIAFGGTRTVTSDHDIWNRNRRVELVVIEINTD